MIFHIENAVYSTTVALFLLYTCVLHYPVYYYIIKAGFNHMLNWQMYYTELVLSINVP